MLPTLRVPFKDQLGMSETLYGARRSALMEGLAHRFRTEVLQVDDVAFVGVLNRFANELGYLAQPREEGDQASTVTERLALLVLRDILLPGGQQQWDAGKKEDVREAWKSPIAQLLAAVIHCVGHAIAERAFLSDDGSSGDAPIASLSDDAVDEESTEPAVEEGDGNAEPDLSVVHSAPTSIDGKSAIALHGVAPGRMARLDLHQSLLRVKLARALRFFASGQFRWQRRERGAEDAAPLQIGQPTYELFGEALLDALPKALGEASLRWQPKFVDGKSQKVLCLAAPLRARLVGFLNGAPMIFTLQPLGSPCEYSKRPSETDDDNLREVPLFGYRRVNDPLRKFLDMLRPTQFAAFLPGINAQQRVAWRINRRVLDCAQMLCALCTDQHEVQPKSSRLSKDQLAEWRDWSTKALFRLQRAGKSSRKILPGQFLSNPLVKSVLEDAFENAEPKAFYLPWKADYRGRIYAETPWLTPQGGDLQRALLEFHRGSVLDDSGWTALKRHGANLADRAMVLGERMAERDVATLAERQLWVEDHEQEILNCAKDPLQFSFWRDMAEPWQFLAFCIAYADGKEGKPCHTPVQIDGTCNGLQHIAALTGDFGLAVEVNVCLEEGGGTTSTPDAVPRDIYSRIAGEARQAFPAWKADASEEKARELAMLELLAACPECFTEDVAAAVCGGARKPETNPDLLNPCQQLCAERSDVRASELAKVLADLLKSARQRLKKSGLVNITPRELADAAVVECNSTISWSRCFDTLGSDLLAALGSDSGERRFETYLNRGVAKAIVMTIPYGAAASSQADNVAGALKKHELALTQEEVTRLRELHAYRFRSWKDGAKPEFNADRLARELLARSIVALMRETIDRTFPKIGQFAETLSAVAQSAKVLPLLWETPLGLPVLQDGFKLNERATASVRLSPDSRTEINFIELTNAVDPAAQQRKLLPNLIHSLDASHMLLSLQSLSEQGIDRFGSIHDCLLIHPNDAEQAGEMVRGTFAKLYAHAPNEIPAVFREWLDWMRLLHEISAFPDRVSDLLLPMTVILRRLDPSAGEADAGAVSALGSAFQSAQSAKGDNLAVLKANAKSRGFPKLAQFLSSLDGSAESAGQLAKLAWLVFLLQNAKGAEKVGKWPDPATSADARFDISSVRQSPYFFS